MGRDVEDHGTVTQMLVVVGGVLALRGRSQSDGKAGRQNALGLSRSVMVMGFAVLRSFAAGCRIVLQRANQAGLDADLACACPDSTWGATVATNHGRGWGGRRAQAGNAGCCTYCIGMSRRQWGGRGCEYTGVELRAAEWRSGESVMAFRFVKVGQVAGLRCAVPSRFHSCRGRGATAGR